MGRTFNCGLRAVLVVAFLDAQRVLRQLQAHQDAWIVGSLAHKQPGKLLNTHPSLLPSFKGVNAQKQALLAGARVTGCTIHFVAEEVDAWGIIAQEAVPVLMNDTEENLSDRIREAEHRAFPAALELA